MLDPSLLDPLRRETAPLAGPADAFEHRARGYRDQYRASRGNDPFPLLAAFGSLWARGFLRSAMQAGGALAATHPSRAARAERWQRLTNFADAFRLLHQRVFTESLVLQRLVADPALATLAERALPGGLLAALRRADEAAHAGVATSAQARGALYDGLFQWEQEQVVGAAVIDAFAAVDWPLLTSVARRPVVRFGFFPALATLRFADFTRMDERIAQGRRAHDIAAAAGWAAVGDRLDQQLAHLDWQPAAERAIACPLASWLSPPQAVLA